MSQSYAIVGSHKFISSRRQYLEYFSNTYINRFTMVSCFRHVGDVLITFENLCLLLILINRRRPRRVKYFVYQFEKREGYCASEKRNVQSSFGGPAKKERNVSSPLSLFISRTRGERIATYACGGSMSLRVCVVTYVRASVCAVTCKNGIAKTWRDYAFSLRRHLWLGANTSRRA